MLNHCETCVPKNETWNSHYVCSIERKILKKDWGNERVSRKNGFGSISYVLWEWVICWKIFWVSGRNLEQHQGMEQRFIWGRTFLEEGFWHSRKPFQHYIHLVIINSLLDDPLRPSSFSWMPFQIMW